MSRVFHRPFCLSLALFVCAGNFVASRAQPPAAPVAAPAAQSSPLPILPPPLAFFRELLAMTSAQREQRLARTPPEKRERLLAKVNEYESMTPQAREQSMMVTELHWYLQQLLQKSPTNGAIQLAQVPESYREIVSDRLNQWKILPPPLQQEVLAHESTRDFFLLGPRTAVNIPPQIIPPPLRHELVVLDGMSPGQRRQVYVNFQSFFDLSASEKQAVLDALPPAERQQAEKTVAGLDRLPREQRDQGLRALGELAGSTEERRRQLFDNIGRWNQLSAEEQRTWLKLAGLLPPLPPIFPPLPPGVSIATNPSRR